MAEQSAWAVVVPQVVQGRMQRLQRLDSRKTLRRGPVPRPVTKSVSADARGVELVGLLGKVPAGEATMTFRGPVARSHERGDSRSYRATLNFGGLVPARHDVELDVTHYGANLASVTLRSAEPLPRRVSEERYAQAVDGALGSLERLLPWQSIVADTAARLFASSGQPAEAAAPAAEAEAAPAAEVDQCEPELGDDEQAA